MAPANEVLDRRAQTPSRIHAMRDTGLLARSIALAAFFIFLVALGLTAAGAIRAANREHSGQTAARFDREVGVTTVALDGQLANTLGLPHDVQGLVVTSTASSRAAAIQAGDVIQAVNGRPVTTRQAATGALGAKPGPVHLLLNRHGHVSRVQLDMARRAKSARLKAGSGGG